MFLRVFGEDAGATKFLFAFLNLDELTGGKRVGPEGGLGSSAKDALDNFFDGRKIFQRRRDFRSDGGRIGVSAVVREKGVGVHAIALPRRDRTKRDAGQLQAVDGLAAVGPSGVD